MRHYGTTNNIPAHQATPDRKPSEGTAAVPVGDGGATPPVWRPPRGLQGLDGLRDDTPTTHSTAGAAGVEAAAGPAGPGRASRRHAERSSRRGRRAGGTPPTGTHSGPAQHGRPRGGRRSVMATSNAGHQAGQRTTRSRPAPQGPGGSRVRPLGGHQRRVQRIWVPSEPRRWQASTTRAAMPASADLPHVRGSYCFLMPTSPSILRTPS